MKSFISEISINYRKLSQLIKQDLILTNILKNTNLYGRN